MSTTSAAARTVAPRLLRTRQAAQYLSIDRSTLHRLRVSGAIPAITSLKYVLFDVDDLSAWIARNKY
jgi:excisionase family DNA binding protein